MDYMVQLEVKVKGRWKPAVRYDPAHGPHCDVFRLDGQEKDLNHNYTFDISTGYQAAVNAADDDIEGNWQTYQKKFRSGRWPK